MWRKHASHIWSATIKYEFKAETPFKRLDVILVDYFEETDDVFSRAAVQRLIKDGHVKVNGKIVKPSRSIAEGDMIIIDLPEKETPNIKPQNIPIKIVYEDEYLAVINKDAGMVVHPAPGNKDGTLVNAMFYHCGGKLSSIGGETRSGVVHRLDKDTSGLIVMAKDNAAHLDLARQFSNKSARRCYITVVNGVPVEKSKRLETFFGRHKTDRKKFTSKLSSGKRAVTNYELISTNNEISVLRVLLETGRTHQIRVHMLENDLPVTGDNVYCKGKDKTGLMKRQALHAMSLTFIHPVFKTMITFISPLPGDMKELIKKAGL
ncbi:MAG: RluA family pseudouridine synthase [Pseudomonadota bacterium]